MVYLVKENNEVLVFYSEEDMKAAGFKKAGLIVSDEKFNSSGCYSRIVGDEIIVGKTEAEITAEEKQNKIASLTAKLEELDREAGAGRFIRDVSLDYAKKNGLNSGKGYQNLVDIEAQAEIIREQLAPLMK